MSNILGSGGTLHAGEQIDSNNGKCHLTMQADGNLVVYRKDNSRATWSAGTNGATINYANMQAGDGNFVIYATALQTPPPPALQSAAGTSPAGDIWIVVTYVTSGETLPSSPAVYSAGTQNAIMVVGPPAPKNGTGYNVYVRVQQTYYLQNSAPIPFGTNFLIPNPIKGNTKQPPTTNGATMNDTALWATSTNGNTGAYLSLEDTGNVVIYDSTRAPLWASDSVQSSFTAPTAAATSLWNDLTTYAPTGIYPNAPSAPGWSYKARLNGTTYVDAPLGWAQLPTATQPGLSMDVDTIGALASTSKPICVTTLIAMLEDWKKLADGVAGTGPLAAMSPVALYSSQIPRVPGAPGTAPTMTVQVPLWLASAFSNRSVAQTFVTAGLLKITPQNLQAELQGVADGHYTLAQSVTTMPPGYIGLLEQISNGVSVPKITDPFLPLVAAKLQQKAWELGISYSIDPSVDSITIEQLIRHTSPLPDGVSDSIKALVGTDGGGACDLWAFLLGYLHQPANQPAHYRNNEYTVLGLIIEACVGTTYNDYSVTRLFSDPQFSTIRRYVVDPSKASLQYSGVTPNFKGGIPGDDCREWSACTGFYATSNQLSAWLYVIASGGIVIRATLDGAGEAPLLSAENLNKLLGSNPLFSGVYNLSGWMVYSHPGASSPGLGTFGADMSIAIAPSGDIITDHLHVNTLTDVGAGTARENAMAAIQRAYPPPPPIKHPILTANQAAPA